MSDKQNLITIYVNNIPPQLNKEGLRELFSEFGEVQHVVQPHNSSWAYVSFLTYKEAELAMRELDRKPPLELKIEISRKNQGTNSKTSRVEPIEAPDFRIKHVSLPEPRGPVTHLIKSAIPRTNLIPHRPHPEAESLYPVEANSDTLDIFENPDSYYDTNLMWSRGYTCISPDGQRHVCMGRGYTWYKLPSYNPNTIKYISEIYESRNPHHYQFSHILADGGKDTCLYCKALAKFQCHTCGGYYCSSDCQGKDWPRHQNECKPMPQLVSSVEKMKIAEDIPQKEQSPIARSVPASIETTPRLPHQNPLKNKSLKSPNNEKTFTFPKPPEIPIFRKSSESFSASVKSPVSVSNHKISPLLSQDICYTKSNRSLEKDLTNDKDLTASNNITPPKSQKVTNLEANSKLPVKVLTTPDLSFQKDTFLTSEFTQVTIALIVNKEQSLYWVQKTSSINELNDMMVEFQKKAIMFPKAEKMILGKSYALTYSEIWHRVKVISLSPLTIRHIDYGSEEKPKNNDFRELDSYYASLAPYARLLRFLQEPDCEEKYNVDDEVKVRLVSHDNNDGSLIVISERAELAGMNAANVPSTTCSTPRASSVSKSLILKNNFQKINTQSDNSLKDIETVFSILQVNGAGFIEIHTPLGNGLYSATIVPDEITDEICDVLQKMPQVCEKGFREIKSYTPKVGEIVAGKRTDGDWIRGKVISVGSFIKIAAIDEGRVEVVKAVVPLAEQFFRIPAIGVSLEATSDLEPSTQWPYTIECTNVVDGQPVVEIGLIQEKGNENKGKLRPWVPTTEQKGVASAKIKSGSKVILTSYKNQYAMFVRSIEEENDEAFQRMTQDIATYGLKPKPLTKLPIQGSMVIAKYQEDEHFYRAIVCEIKGDRILVKYIDYGNAEETSLKHLYEIPAQFKEMGSFLKAIILKDVPKDTAMNKEVAEYLNTLVGQETTLIVQSSDKYFKEVVLSYNENVVNNIIKELLVPSWVKTPPETNNDCYMANRLEVTKLGNVGDVISALVLCTLSVGKQYFICVADYDLVNHVTNVMQQKINDYVESNKDHYIPRDNELCIAPFDGTYYRALCIGSKGPMSSIMMFIDFGNVVEVKHTDIRMMTKDFIEPKPMGSLCTITNLLPEDKEVTEPLKKRLQELIVENENIEMKIVGFDLENLEHLVEVEGIRKTLEAENLL